MRDLGRTLAAIVGALIVAAAAVLLIAAVTKPTGADDGFQWVPWFITQPAPSQPLPASTGTSGGVGRAVPAAPAPDEEEPEEEAPPVVAPAPPVEEEEEPEVAPAPPVVEEEPAPVIVEDDD